MHGGKTIGRHAVRQKVGRCRTRGNLRECTSLIKMPLPSVNKAAHSGFETQRRHHQKSKTGVSVAPQKGHASAKYFKEKKERKFSLLYDVNRPFG